MKVKAIVLVVALLLSLWVGVSLATGLDTPGAVYTMTNDPDGNEVIMFDRDAKGMLTQVGSISTGGNGSGGGLDPLASQGSLVLSQDQRWLLAVNAGSNEISVFRVLADGLALVDKVGSGGDFPVSLTIFHDLVYVLNAGSPNITGFYLNHTGELIPLEGSTRLLGMGGFAQVGFDPKGKNLIATDRSGFILVYSVGKDGLPSMDPAISTSNGLVPFGFIFDRWDHLLVSEAGSGAVTSYDVLADGTLQVISPSVANGQTATCWIAGNRQYAFTANTASSTISAYRVKAGKGNVVLREAVAGIGNLDIDVAITINGRFLYTLNAGNGTVGMFKIKSEGTLVDLGMIVGGLSIFAQGIAAR
jgi:6-phosphogluconolactonase